MRIIKTIAILVLLSVQFYADAQQLSFSIIKAENSPYLQFNDIIEHDNIIWLVTNEGLYQSINNQLIIIIRKENLAKFIVVNKQLLVWSIYGEFYSIKKNKLLPLSFNDMVKKRLQNKIINSVIETNNTFYISSVIGGGILKIDQTKEEVTTLEKQPSYPYYVTQFNTKYLSGNNSNSTKKQLAVNLNNKPFFIPLAENLNSSKTNILKLKDGTFIFTRQYEAIRFNKNKIINRVFVEKNIENIFQSTDGKIWFTLNGGGIISYTNGNFNSSNSTRYLGNKTVISITQDKNGNMWFGTSGNGVYVLKKDIKIEYNAPKIFSSTTINTEEIKSLSLQSELPKLNESSKIINTSTIKNDTTPPVVFINTVKINGVDTTTLTYYELAYNQNALEINISGIFSENSELQYKYILEGKETQWNYTTNTNIYYTSLSPGNYTFKAFVMSDGGIWSSLPATVTFSIKTPFYQSFWFIFSILFLVLTIILGVVFIVARKNQQQKALYEEEKRKVLVSELHALRSQMNPHFIFNTLSSIQSFITKNDNKDAVIYLSKFSKLMRATLENTKKQRVPIKDEVESLGLYMDLEKLRLNNKFDYHITIDKNLDTLFEEIPPMLIQPYLENAIWHGISHKNGKGIIKVNFTLENENLLRCEIEDDGVGRKASALKRKEPYRNHDISKTSKASKSLGMAITKERLEIINSLKNSKLSVKIIDLIDNNKAKGTKIELFIPLD